MCVCVLTRCKCLKQNGWWLKQKQNIFLTRISANGPPNPLPLFLTLQANCERHRFFEFLNSNRELKSIMQIMCITFHMFTQPFHIAPFNNNYQHQQQHKNLQTLQFLETLINSYVLCIFAQCLYFLMNRKMNKTIVIRKEKQKKLFIPFIFPLSKVKFKQKKIS